MSPPHQTLKKDLTLHTCNRMATIEEVLKEFADARAWAEKIMCEDHTQIDSGTDLLLALDEIEIELKAKKITPQDAHVRYLQQCTPHY